MTPETLIWRGLQVPYITPWSGETMSKPPLVVRHGRLSYRDEGPQGVPSWGIAGVLYDAALRALPGPPDAEDELHLIPYEDDARLRWVLAAREVVALYGVQPVTDLDALADTAGSDGYWPPARG
ncbi:hypothetical protein [Streptomyces ziwulingensis]|uniref:Uncharacterized protein n=1 Tax=Streptomyces ziwulingensis TaxID=1045501 RepID=A0ABP9CWC4_9ACTN